MGMATLRKTLTITMDMPHTATTIMVQLLVPGMISTLQTGREAIIILTFIVVAPTQVPTVIVTSGLEAIISVPTRERFTTKCLLN